MGRRKKRVPLYGERNPLDRLPRVKHLSFGECIGEGHFSRVFEGVYHDSTDVAIKVIERGSERLIDTEIDILTDMRGFPHIVQLIEVVHVDHTLLIFELLNGMNVDDIFDHLTVNRMRFLIQSVLEALNAAHSKGIVHRDVKLGNIIVTPHFRDVKLIDWGCGQYVSDVMSSKAGSRQCRPPEMLMGYNNYGTKGDIWAVGVLILYILAGGVVPWRSRTSEDALLKMSVYFGGNAFDRLADKLHLDIDPYLDDEFPDEPEKTLESCFAPDFRDLADPNLVDLMKKLMTVNPDKRPTASEALDHPFFHVNK